MQPKMSATTCLPISRATPAKNCLKKKFPDPGVSEFVSEVPWSFPCPLLLVSASQFSSFPSIVWYCLASKMRRWPFIFYEKKYTLYNEEEMQYSILVRCSDRQSFKFEPHPNPIYQFLLKLDRYKLDCSHFTALPVKTPTCLIDDWIWSKALAEVLVWAWAWASCLSISCHNTYVPEFWVSPPFSLARKEEILYVNCSLQIPTAGAHQQA